jgi:hypothetical protein
MFDATALAAIRVVAQRLNLSPSICLPIGRRSRIPADGIDQPVDRHVLLPPEPIDFVRTYRPC